MALLALGDIKTQAKAGKINFTRSGAAGDVMVQQLLAVFGLETLTLEVHQQSLKQDAGSIQFEATAASLLQVNDQPVHLVFFKNGSKLECLLSATLPDSWDFAWGYPNLPDYWKSLETTTPDSSFFYDLKFDGSVKVVYASCDRNSYAGLQNQLLDTSLVVANIHKGLNYKAQLDLKEIPFLQSIWHFSGNTSEAMAVNGYLDPTSLQIRLLLQIAKSFTLLDFFHITISSLELSTASNRFFSNAGSGISLLATMKLGESGNSYGVRILWPVGSTMLILKNTEAFPIPGLDALTKIIGDQLPGDKLPVPTGNSMYIRDIALHFSLAPPQATYLSITTGPDESWQYNLLNNALSFEDFLLKWELSYGTKAQSLCYLLSAFEIGGGLVNVSASFPDFVIRGELANNQSIDLPGLLANIVPAVKQLPKLSILDLEVSIDVSRQAYFFDITIDSDWEIAIGAKKIRLQALQFSLEKDTESNILAVSGNLQIASIDILVSATKGQDVSGGWEFIGSTGWGQSIEMGELIDYIARSVAASKDDPEIPEALKSLNITNLYVQFNTGNEYFHFSCEGSLDLGDAGQLNATIDLLREAEGAKFSVTGTMNLGTRQFRIDFSKDRSTGLSALVGSYKNTSGDAIAIRNFVTPISEEFAEYIPAGLDLSLKDVFIAYESKKVAATTTTGFLAGADISLEMGLAELPLVGSMFPDGQLAGIRNLQIMITSIGFTEELAGPVNTALSANHIGSLPVKTMSANASSQQGRAATIVLPKGLSIAITLGLGQQSWPLVLNTAPASPAGEKKTNANSNGGRAGVQNTQTANSAPVRQRPGYGAVWLPIQKSLGPVSINRVGIAFKKGQLDILLDAALKAGPLTIDLIGLTMGSPLDHFEPHFGLMGLGIDFKNKAVEIGGELLRSQQVASNVALEYDGYLILKFKKLTVSAIGSYAKLKDGTTSLFVYVTIDYPIGGPPWFYVTGVSAGFGFNREIIAPSIEQLDQFPLISEALYGSGGTKSTTGDPAIDKSTLSKELDKLQTYIPPREGEYFLAAGIKFTSFELVNALALLTFSFGERLVLELFGRAFLVQPPVPPDMILQGNSGTMGKLSSMSYMAKVAFDIDTRMDFSTGILQVFAEIKNGSFVYNPLCKIDGSMIFRSWFSGRYNGDFILVVGGYHKDYKVPDNYPARQSVDMVSLYYGINDKLYAKGSLYFALTPSCVMAGGDIEANFDGEVIAASFTLFANLLLKWKPYHYQLSAGVEISASAKIPTPFGTKKISISLSAKLDIWGPEFSGKVKVKVGLASVTIKFGDTGNQIPPAISWDEFKDSFLPKANEVISIGAADGLLKKLKAGNKEDSPDVWLFNNKTLVFVISTGVPVSEANLYLGGSDLLETSKTNTEILSENQFEILGAQKEFGVKSMHVNIGDMLARMYIQISREGEPADADDFVFSPVYKDVPSALWGDYTIELEDNDNDKVNQDRFISEALAGIEVTPGQAPKPGETHDVPVENLKYNTSAVEKSYQWEKEKVFSPASAKKDVTRRQALKTVLQREQYQATIKNAFSGLTDSTSGTALVRKEALENINMSTSSIGEEVDAMVEAPLPGKLTGV